MTPARPTAPPPSRFSSPPPPEPTLTAIPEPIGTLTATNTTPPAQQNAVGIGGEVQLAFPHFAIAGGWTPYNFLVSTFTGRVMWKPGNGPFTFIAYPRLRQGLPALLCGSPRPRGQTRSAPGSNLGRCCLRPGPGTVLRTAMPSPATTFRPAASISLATMSSTTIASMATAAPTGAPHFA